jgi:hypothetical protein
MPLVKMYLPSQVEEVRAKCLATAVHQALVTTCAVPPDDCFQMTFRLAPTAIHFDPHFGGVSRSADASIVEITFLQGRTDTQKRSLYQAIVAGAKAGGWSPDDVMVALVENGRIDWSLGRGEAYVDVVAGR